MWRIFLSHSSKDNRYAWALKDWLVQRNPPLANEIFLDFDRHGIRSGTKWKDALRQASNRCEAVICLLSKNWEASKECYVEYRTAENLNKRIFAVRIDPYTGSDPTREWQQIDLVGDGPTTEIDVGDGQEPVALLTEGLRRLRDDLVGAGISPESFVWPPPDDENRIPYRGWDPLEEVDAAVFFGRDAQIVRGLDALRGMRKSGVETMFVVLGPSGTGKSSFLRAGLLPRVRRDDRNFLLLDIVRPQRNVLTGDTGLARSIHQTRKRLGLDTPSRGVISRACEDGDVGQLRRWLAETQRKADTLIPDKSKEAPSPTLVMPVDQIEELFGVDAGAEAPLFLKLIAALAYPADEAKGPSEESGPARPSEHEHEMSDGGLIVAATIRTDRYHALQTAPELSQVDSVVFDHLKPMPRSQFKEVIKGPGGRGVSGSQLRIEPALVDRLLDDCDEGADTLPLLALTLRKLFEDYADVERDIPEQAYHLTVNDYDHLGGMERVVQTVIDEILSAAPAEREDQLNVLRAAFIPWLATFTPGNDQPMRRVALWRELPTESYPLLEQFVAKRLLVKDKRESDREVVVEVALESLLRQWKELAAWLDDRRDDLINADALHRDAKSWDESGRKEAWLWEGERLLEAENLLAQPGFTDLLKSTHDFLNASRLRENARRAREEQRQEAERQAARARAVTRQETALRLTSQALGMIAGAQPGGDVRAFQQLLAADALASGTGVDDAVRSALMSRPGLRKIIQTDAAVRAVAFNSSGDRVVTGGDSDVLTMWDPHSGLPVGELTGHTDFVYAVSFSPDGRRIASGGYDRTIRIWDADTGRKIGDALTGHRGRVLAVAFGPDHHRVVSGGADNCVRLWDTDRGHQIGEPMRGHTGWVRSVGFSPDGRLVVSGGEDRTVRVWDVQSRHPVYQPLTGHTDVVHSVGFSSDGRHVVSGSADATVRVWDAKSGLPVGEPLSIDSGEVFSVALSPDDNSIVCGGVEGALRRFDVRGSQLVGPPLVGHEGWVWAVAYSTDGQRIVSGGADSTVRLWDAGFDGVGIDPVIGHQDVVSALAFFPDGASLISGSRDTTLRVWSANNLQPIAGPLHAHNSAVESVAISLDGQRLVTGSAGGTIRLWDAHTTEPIGRSLSGHTGSVRCVAFSPDGRRIVSGGEDGTLRLWDAGDGRSIAVSAIGHPGGVSTIAFRPDGRWIASGGADAAIRLWDAETGQAVGQPLIGHDGDVIVLNFNPAGDRIVSGGADARVRLWDIGVGDVVATPLEGHESSVLGAAFTPEGRRLISASADTVRLWDARDGRAIADPLDVPRRTVYEVAFSPDRRQVVLAGDQTLQMLKAPVGWVDSLRNRVASNMSHAQWRQWISADIEYAPGCPGLPVPADEPAS
jgi:WD40 repeat protein